MKSLNFLRSGSGAIWSIELAALRWGGGASPGKYHVFLLAHAPGAGLPDVSAQCVVDDFGDLVEVPQ